MEVLQMKVADYVVDELIKYGVTDTFGIPGGVILKLLYAMERREPELSPHLNYHEQMAGFAACGFAQASGKLGVAYATRGPGITNMVTCIAEAYQESLPVLFITAHGSRSQSGMRFEDDQELDMVRCVSGFTKYAANIDSADQVVQILHDACNAAISERKGPVLLDFSASLWEQEVVINNIDTEENDKVLDDIVDYSELALACIKNHLSIFMRPLILIGDGIRHAFEKEKLYEIADKLRIPIISSRGAQDLLSGSPYYFGYIGSHGTRYSNFILSKADLIITIGNRLAFPINSKSFYPIVSNTKIIRLDIDEMEFCRELPNAETYRVDAYKILSILIEGKYYEKEMADWIETCSQLRGMLESEDCPEPVLKLESIIEKLDSSYTYVCDVGNNEFWFARAFEKVRRPGTVLYSKSFGTLGVALGRAIGTYYASRDNVVCVIGDQGFQYNLQELQYISKWNLPIKIIVLNNGISGMIADHENQLFGNNLIHVNRENGYYVLDVEKIAMAYGIDYTTDEIVATDTTKKALIYEVIFNEDALIPNLPKGNTCQDMEPLIPRDKYDYLNNL
jgi:acetolactate synthase-1/2/3 large subunit